MMITLQMFFNALAINMQNLMSALDCMLWGMIGIFTVIIILVVCVKLLNVLTKDKKKTDDNDGTKSE